MTGILDNLKNQPREANLDFMETYVGFRNAVPKPTTEDAHIRHILRFYVARSLLKSGYERVYILPEIGIEGGSISVDVAAKKGDETVLAMVEPESVTPETVATLETLHNLPVSEIIVVHSQYGNSADVPDRFAEDLDAGRMRLMAVVPPPFDDVYEYDIWMFETTFRNVLDKRKEED